ncbi:MAG: proton-conducting transporter membrane subunit [Caldilinea sp.]
MDGFGALLILAWLAPLLLGWLQLARPRTSVWLAASAAAPALLAALLTPVGTVVDLPWLLLGARYGMDATAQTFLFFTALLWLLASIFGAGYLAKDGGRSRFFSFFLLAMAGNFGLIVAQEMISYYTWFALMSFASYGLVIHTWEEEARKAARVYIVLVVVGEVLLFAALALLFAASGTLGFDAAAGNLAATLVFVSFGIKAGVILLHVWLPLAHPAAPIPASAVLSGAMIKAGVLGWLRFLQPVDAYAAWGDFLIAAGLATAFYGALIGVTQRNVKTVLAYSSISQIGLITVAVGAWLVSGRVDQAALTAVLLYAMHHALAKGSLFLGVGFVGAGKGALAVLLLPALALAGFPLTSGAVAKAALKTATATLPGAWPSLLGWLLPLAAVSTTLLMARFLWLMAHSPAPSKAAPRVMWGAWLALNVGVATALFLWPTGAPAVSDSFKPENLWVATWPVMVGILMAAVAARTVTIAPTTPTGDVLVLYRAVLRTLYVWLHTVRHKVAEVEERLPTDWGSVRPVAFVSRAAVQWELRLRSNWLLVGGALLALTVALLTMLYSTKCTLSC